MNQLVECLSADSTLKAPGGLEIQEKRNKYKDGKENKDFGKVRKDKKTKKLEKQVGTTYSENRIPRIWQLDNQGTRTEEGGQPAVGTVLQWHLKGVSTGEVHLLGEQDEREDPSGEMEDVIYLWFLFGFLMLAFFISCFCPL